ncbi:uncharacterized protein tex15 isoform X2 [Denticeps clupeoides]|uniref:uncharacterized protein tex15 isoform X2 n=1 Tax=Denticeps clupeoides TaxID=299321 RepID=UPI0010A3767D|nr:testis-expressed protein 15 isoform X2 [Denticeps clupeoides]
MTEILGRPCQHLKHLVMFYKTFNELIGWYSLINNMETKNRMTRVTGSFLNSSCPEVLKPKNFTIPRKKRTAATDVLEPCLKESWDYCLVHSILSDCRLDHAQETCKWGDVNLVHNDYLLKAFTEKRNEMRSIGRHAREMEEKFCFLTASTEETSQICKEGLKVNSTNQNSLGKPSHGVHLYRHADVALKNSGCHVSFGQNLIIFKVLLGKMKKVTPSLVDSNTQDPTINFDCHIAKGTVLNRKTISQQYLTSSVFVFDYNLNLELTTRPRQCLPYAVVSVLSVKITSPLPSSIPASVTDPPQMSFTNGPFESLKHCTVAQRRGRGKSAMVTFKQFATSQAQGASAQPGVSHLLPQGMGSVPVLEKHMQSFTSIIHSNTCKKSGVEKVSSVVYSSRVIKDPRLLGQDSIQIKKFLSKEELTTPSEKAVVHNQNGPSISDHQEYKSVNSATGSVAEEIYKLDEQDCTPLHAPPPSSSLKKPERLRSINLFNMKLKKYSVYLQMTAHERKEHIFSKKNMSLDNKKLLLDRIEFYETYYKKYMKALLSPQEQNSELCPSFKANEKDVSLSETLHKPRTQRIDEEICREHKQKLYYMLSSPSENEIKGDNTALLDDKTIKTETERNILRDGEQQDEGLVSVLLESDKMTIFESSVVSEESTKSHKIPQNLSDLQIQEKKHRHLASVWTEHSAISELNFKSITEAASCESNVICNDSSQDSMCQKQEPLAIIEKSIRTDTELWEVAAFEEVTTARDIDEDGKNKGGAHETPEVNFQSDDNAIFITLCKRLQFAQIMPNQIPTYTKSYLKPKTAEQPDEINQRHDHYGESSNDWNSVDHLRLEITIKADEDLDMRETALLSERFAVLQFSRSPHDSAKAGFVDKKTALETFSEENEAWKAKVSNIQLVKNFADRYKHNTSNNLRSFGQKCRNWSSCHRSRNLRKEICKKARKVKMQCLKKTKNEHLKKLLSWRSSQSEASHITLTDSGCDSAQSYRIQTTDSKDSVDSVPAPDQAPDHTLDPEDPNSNASPEDFKRPKESGAEKGALQNDTSTVALEQSRSGGTEEGHATRDSTENLSYSPTHEDAGIQYESELGNGNTHTENPEVEIVEETDKQQHSGKMDNDGENKALGDVRDTKFEPPGNSSVAVHGQSPQVWVVLDTGMVVQKAQLRSSTKTISTGPLTTAEMEENAGKNSARNLKEMNPVTRVSSDSTTVWPFSETANHYPTIELSTHPLNGTILPSPVSSRQRHLGCQTVSKKSVWGQSAGMGTVSAPALWREYSVMDISSILREAVHADFLQGLHPLLSKCKCMLQYFISNFEKDQGIEFHSAVVSRDIIVQSYQDYTPAPINLKYEAVNSFLELQMMMEAKEYVENKLCFLSGKPTNRSMLWYDHTLCGELYKGKVGLQRQALLYSSFQHGLAVEGYSALQKYHFAVTSLNQQLQTDPHCSYYLYLKSQREMFEIETALRNVTDFESFFLSVPLSCMMNFGDTVEHLMKVQNCVMAFVDSPQELTGAFDVGKAEHLSIICRYLQEKINYMKACPVMNSQVSWFGLEHLWFDAAKIFELRDTEHRGEHEEHLYYNGAHPNIIKGEMKAPLSAVQRPEDSHEPEAPEMPTDVREGQLWSCKMGTTTKRKHSAKEYTGNRTDETSTVPEKLRRPYTLLGYKNQNVHNCTEQQINFGHFHPANYSENLLKQHLVLWRRSSGGMQPLLDCSLSAENVSRNYGGDAHLQVNNASQLSEVTSPAHHSLHFQSCFPPTVHALPPVMPLVNRSENAIPLQQHATMKYPFFLWNGRTYNLAVPHDTTLTPTANLQEDYLAN